MNQIVMSTLSRVVIILAKIDMIRWELSRTYSYVNNIITEPIRKKHLEGCPTTVRVSINVDSG